MSDFQIRHLEWEWRKNYLITVFLEVICENVWKLTWRILLQSVIWFSLIQFAPICSLGQASDDMCEPTARSRRQANLQGGFLRVRCVARGLGIALRNSLATLRQTTMFVDSRVLEKLWAAIFWPGPSQASFLRGVLSSCAVSLLRFSSAMAPQQVAPTVAMNRWDISHTIKKRELLGCERLGVDVLYEPSRSPERCSCWKLRTPGTSFCVVTRSWTATVVSEGLAVNAPRQRFFVIGTASSFLLKGNRWKR